MLGTAGAILVALALAGDPLGSGQVRRILEKEHCQTELPLLESKEEALLSPPSQAVAPLERTSIRLPSPSFLPVALVAALLVAGVLAILLRRLPLPAPVPPLARSPSTRAALRRPERSPVPGEPDRLAREGRFGEAIHALLLQALAELGGGVRPAQTSREVLRGAKLGEEVRAALGALVSAVERGHFGARPVGADDWEAALADFGRLQEAWCGRE